MFELWCWKRLLRVHLTTRRSNQSMLKDIIPEYSLEGLILKLQYFGQLYAKGQLTGKDPNAAKDYRQKGKAAAKNEMVR